MKRFVVLIVFGLVALPGGVAAEELLTKNGGDYLGAQKSPTVFVTCQGGEMEIGNGTVRHANEKCRTGVIGPLGGVVKLLDSSSLTMQDNRGNEIRFRLTAKEFKLIDGLSPGSTVSVSGRSAGQRTIK